MPSAGLYWGLLLPGLWWAGAGCEDLAQLEPGPAGTGLLAGAERGQGMPGLLRLLGPATRALEHWELLPLAGPRTSPATRAQVAKAHGYRTEL